MCAEAAEKLLRTLAGKLPMRVAKLTRRPVVARVPRYTDVLHLTARPRKADITVARKLGLRQKHDRPARTGERMAGRQD